MSKAQVEEEPPQEQHPSQQPDHKSIPAESSRHGTAMPGVSVGEDTAQTATVDQGSAEGPTEFGSIAPSYAA